MARRTVDVTITDENRDKGKLFVLTEKSALRAEKWAQRVLLLAAQSGADVVGNIGGGMAALAVVGIQSVLGGVRFADLEPLLDEMLTCVQIVPNPQNRGVVRALIEEDIEEVETLLTLRQEVLSLHMGFSFADALSRLKGTTSAPDQT